jgi:tetratricopeptide (TPR) repeat protein
MFTRSSLRLSLALLAIAALSGCKKDAPQATPPSNTAAADALLAEGKPIDAIIAYRALPPSEGAQRGMGLAFAMMRRWDEAHAALAPYVKAHPEDLIARSALVSALVGRGELPAARSEANALAAAAPADMPIQLTAAALADDEASRKAALSRLAGFKRDVADPKSEPYELLVTRWHLMRALGDQDGADAALSASDSAPLRDAGSAVLLAETYQRLAQPLMADRVLQKVTADSNALPAALRVASEISLDLNKPERVAPLLARIPEAQRVPPVDALLSSRAKLALGENDAAVDELSALLASLGDKHKALASRVRLWLSRAHSARGDAAKAKEALLGIDDPSLERERTLALAELELSSGNAEGSIAALKPIVDKDKDKQEVAAQLMLASAYVKANKPDEAQKLLLALGVARPDDPRIPYTLGTVLEAAGDKAGAEREHKRALEVAPGSLAPLRRLLALLDGAQRTADADQLLRDQIAKAPRSGTLRQMLGLRFEERKDLPAAEAEYKAAIDADGGADTAWIALADHYARTARPARALELLEHVLRRAPGTADALVRAAQAQHTLGQPTQAIARYEQALQLRPRDIGIQNNLALLLAEQPATRDRALELAEAAHKGNPGSLLILDTLGYVRLKRGELDQALELLRKSAAGLPQVAEVQHHLGIALLLKGDPSGRKLIDAARKQDPALPTADQALSGVKP